MDKKIFLDGTMGSVYWLEGKEVRFAPMNSDNTCNLSDGGIVEMWSEDGEDASRAEEARVRSMLA